MKKRSDGFQPGLESPRQAVFASCRLKPGLPTGVFIQALGVLCAAAALGAPAPESPVPFRIGVSYASFGTVSPNDASAALKAWAKTLSKERKLKLNVQVEVFDQESQLRQALAQEQVDAVSMTSEEFVQSGQKPEAVFLTAKNKTFTEQYVILVHRGSGIDDLPGLKGCKLVRHVSPATGPALPWLETLLASRALGRAERVFGEVTTIENPSKAVLRVFFRQSDACLVTTNAFGLACELNPQLRKELKVLATSPALISSFFFFRPGYAGSARQELEAALMDLHSTPAGQQVLTVFQGSRLEKQPLSCLETTRQLLAEFERLKNFASVDDAPALPPRAAVLQRP